MTKRISDLRDCLCACWNCCLKVKNITPPPNMLLAWTRSDCLDILLYLVGGGEGSAEEGGGRGRRVVAPAMGPVSGRGVSIPSARPRRQCAKGLQGVLVAQQCTVALHPVHSYRHPMSSRQHERVAGGRVGAGRVNGGIEPAAMPRDGTLTTCVSARYGKGNQISANCGSWRRNKMCGFFVGPLWAHARGGGKDDGRKNGTKRCERQIEKHYFYK